ncbi:P-loop containing nucleoside triphosphate hydrolase protein, partial [Roridomyces roridus]
MLLLRCTQCRPRLFLGYRFRSQVVRKPPRNNRPPPEKESVQAWGLPGSALSPTTVLVFFRANVAAWTSRREVHDRLVKFGAPSRDATQLLKAFSRDATAGVFDSPDAMKKYGLMKLQDTDETDADIAFSNIFFLWLAGRQPVRGADPETTARLLRLAQGASRSHPEEEYAAARQLRRKVIMHVGPTNSGKTYRALRALVAAKLGVYAGPLRLLAHEIWERVNLGQLAPLGASQEEIVAAASVPYGTDHPFARACNMITGEEQKIVSPVATIQSCTVEMLYMGTQYDVAVIDEIQMISDVERGWCWTNAVLGLPAKELHLCGEETAVPLVEQLLKNTGDELIVNRYERLTPLEVEDSSLENDLNRVRPGDCIVAFSRNAIFGLKRQVEAKTKMKCAVVYGRLPPEIRSEQAALFNDPQSGYDVLIGSDAIGMGLNLKIRRTIFEAVAKFEGRRGIKPLSVSQTKQIAGRAGRFGMLHQDEEPKGFVTTLKPEDLPFLRNTVAKTLPPLSFARIGPSKSAFHRISSLLPPNASTETVCLASMHAGHLPMPYRHSTIKLLSDMSEFIDNKGDFTLDDRHLFLQAPFPWRDPRGLEAVTEFLNEYYSNMRVDVVDSLRKVGLLQQLEEAEQAMNAPEQGPQIPVSKQLLGLEALHKILVVYIWLGFRNPVSYPSHDVAADLKERLERVLHWSLQHITFDGQVPEQSGEKEHRIEYRSKRQVALDEQEKRKSL